MSCTLGCLLEVLDIERDELCGCRSARKHQPRSDPYGHEGARTSDLQCQQHVEAGGLMSYGPNFPELYRRAAEYVDKILRGAKPADIPVERPTKFDLVVNLTTAKALGVQIPPTLLARANEVIERAGGR
jgi:hypothetical protein